MKAFGFTGGSGSGKTTLIEKLIPRFKAWGLQVSAIKHAHHDVDLDRPGKDSWRLRQAGCDEVMLAAPRRWALLHESRDQPTPGIEALLSRLSPCDLVLVEGWRLAALPCIEVRRRDCPSPPRWPEDPLIVALASNQREPVDMPQFDLNAVEAIAAFIGRHTGVLTMKRDLEHPAGTQP